VQAIVRSWLFRPRQRPERPVSPQALDAWETRLIAVSSPENARAPQDVGADSLAEEVEHETVSAHR
jgi:hypothetical protein